jgi:glycosyltransferase involved in cell wall biosynthesis
MSVLGGGERVALHSIIAAIEGGHDVYLASENFNTAAFEDFFASPGVFNKVHMLTYPSFRPIAEKMVLYQRLLYHGWRLRRILPRAGDIDLILSTQDAAYMPAVRIPTVQYCYFPEWFVHLESNPSSMFWRLYYTPGTLFYRSRVDRIDLMLSTSNFTKGFVKRKWGRDSTTLYPPCPIDLYRGLNGPKENLVITIGRVVPEKRMNLFLEIARQLPQVKFAIIGSVAPERESYLQRLKDAAPSNVSFVMSPLRRVKDLLAKARIYVHCALNEHFGISIVEAMAAGCVPIVHNSGGAREIVTNSVGYKWDTVDEASRQIANLTQNDSLRTELSEAATARSELFRPEVFESGITKILDRFSGNRDDIIVQEGLRRPC